MKYRRLLEHLKSLTPAQLERNVVLEDLGAGELRTDVRFYVSVYGNTPILQFNYEANHENVPE